MPRDLKGLEAVSIDGANFIESYETIQKVIATIIREERRPFLSTCQGSASKPPHLRRTNGMVS
jgi:TPP-dependent pyruvate/acetoin dehydrogenase alpha subunit